MGLWHRMKVRLGLEDDWDDEYYDDEDDEYADDGHDTGSASDSRRDAAPYQSPYDSGAHPGAVKRLDRGPDLDRARGGSSSALRSVPTGGASVTPVSANMKMHIVEPKSFTEAQAIADKFKQGTPVIMNMASTPSRPCQAPARLRVGAHLRAGRRASEGVRQGVHAHSAQRRSL